MDTDVALTTRDAAAPTVTARRTMKALVYRGAARKEWADVPRATLHEAGDAVVRVDAVTICGTDLHILQGDLPEVGPGRVLGHEAVGTIVEVGSGVLQRRVGERVLVSCISSCGTCRYCRDRHPGQCLGGGGWILGHTIDGTQAEYVRVPFADTSTYTVPEHCTDEEVLMLADIGPTGYEVGALNGRVSPADVVVVVGAGPVGLAAMMGARLFSPTHIVAVDVAASRLVAAREFGADILVNSSLASPEVAVHRATAGLGADVVIEAVGLPETFELCTRLVRPGGHVANVGVHGRPATLHLEQLWIKNVTITTGLVDTTSTPVLLALLQNHQINLRSLVTHRLALDEVVAGYDLFARAAETGALKVVMTRG